ncbi:substrate-binding periplasmic protein [Thalassospira alkalitolerans]|uniref:substrate-binding periplasmic protein n=1 Tax=Thalassospira alkalitolerans TaxID=1293890 RepID=UPI003AA9B83E
MKTRAGFIAILLTILFGVTAVYATIAATANAQTIKARLPMANYSPYCKGEISWAEHSEYHIELLRLAIRYSGQNIDLVPVCMEYPTEARRVSMLKTNDLINVVFFGTTPSREADLLPVYVPIYLGTTGLRLFLTRPDISQKLVQVRTIRDLQGFSMGQGLGWPDVEILKRNGFDVTGGRYKALHEMLHAKRFDLYPRAYWQIAAEQKWMSYRAPDIMIDTNVALYYPQPIYIFVSPFAPDLRNAIKTGLERAHQDGKILELLQRHPQTAPSFAELDLKALRIIEIDNPLLPARSRLALAKYSLIHTLGLSNPLPESTINHED